ncbi:flavin reductase family protein [Streptomyces muensis]|uniref:Flavin reductase family protein n=1 Tax=Streptomyces muensis TaxID=1077944 RepID=A0A9X1PSC1_STRM4|nr:flavin reductase family protein [Streptomyces muensis]MCF1592592.1 flavin reductase family protein [Streptomyces muensis]
MTIHETSLRNGSDLQDRFREVMAGVATPVSVVTTLSDGRPHGTTVSAFTSLSMAPPMVLVSLDRGSDLLTLVRRSGRFGLNVLGTHQTALALAFAKKGTDKFAGVIWNDEDGLPRLPDALGWLSCDVTDLVDGGDHVVVLGAVHAAETSAGRPLTYHARVFGTHAALEQV